MVNTIRISTKGLIKKYVQLKDNKVKNNNNNNIIWANNTSQQSGTLYGYNTALFGVFVGVVFVRYKHIFSK